MKMKRTVRMPLRRAPQSRNRPPAAALRARAATVEEAYDHDEDEDYGAEEEPNMKFSHALMVVLALHVLAVGGVFAFNSLKAKQAEAKAPAKTAAAETAVKPAAEIEGWHGKVHTVTANDTLSRLAASYKVSVEALAKENGIDTKTMLRIGQALKIPAAEKVAEKPAAKPAAKPSETATTAAAKQAFIATKIADAPAAKPAGISAIPQPKPASNTAATPAPAKAAAPAPAAAEENVYVVARGDNPYNIAKKLHVSYNDLIAINNITDPTKIQIGQKLKIPAKK